ncbi:MAG: methylated-DNA--[protein]-cysteine S-methyltransferase [Roseibacillus sp.]
MKAQQTYLGRETDSPVGPLTLLASENGLAGVYFEGRYEGGWEGGESKFLDQAEAELAEYFSGDRIGFEVALDAEGTDFQCAVWKALKTIPFGEVVSYLQIAERIDNPKAVRAVGLANGANPISIIVPCHRVIGADGKLTGYGGGLERKRTLLVHEKAGILC